MLSLCVKRCKCTSRGPNKLGRWALPSGVAGRDGHLKTFRNLVTVQILVVVGVYVGYIPTKFVPLGPRRLSFGKCSIPKGAPSP